MSDFTKITIPNPEQSFTSENSQNDRVSDALIDVWTNRKISGMQYFCIDVFSSSGSAWTWTFTDINLIGQNGDRAKSYTQEIIVWAGNTTAQITKSYTIDTPISNNLIVPPWKIAEIYWRPSSSTQTLRIDVTGTYRFIKWSTLDLTNTTDNVTIINSWTSNLKLKLKFATSASERPIFWFLLKIF